MPAPIPGLPATSSDDLQRLSKPQLWLHIFFYTFQVYALRLPAQQITQWTEDVIDSFMELYMDYVQHNSNPVPTNPLQLLINFAVREQWTVAELVWTAIAVKLNSFPILWATIQDCFLCATNTGDYAWRMPIPVNRTIRRIHTIALPNTWF